MEETHFWPYQKQLALVAYYGPLLIIYRWMIGHQEPLHTTLLCAHLAHLPSFSPVPEWMWKGHSY